LNLNFNAEDFGPLVEAIVTKVLAKIETAQDRMGDKLAYDEPEAARLLDLKTHQLRDARLRGDIVASKITGRRIRYAKQDLLNYLAANRWSAN
jgi:hypothetical protein